MNATQLLAHFDRLSEAPGAVPRLRRFILDLAVRGQLDSRRSLRRRVDGPHRSAFSAQKAARSDNTFCTA